MLFRGPVLDWGDEEEVRTLRLSLEKLDAERPIQVATTGLLRSSLQVVAIVHKGICTLWMKLISLSLSQYQVLTVGMSFALLLCYSIILQ